MIVFKTPWFQVLAQPVPGLAEPYYTIQSPDVAIVVALDVQGRLLLVRQYRPAIGATTLELPAGLVDDGETPEMAAWKELREETRHEAPSLELLTTLHPATGRFTNTLWCFFAAGVRPCAQPQGDPEDGIELVAYEKGIPALLGEKEFCSAVSHATILAAISKGKLELKRG
jgi:ADP-ribose pyrophosphatase